MHTDQEELIISQSVLEMITVAHEYCLFFEKVEKYQSQEIFSYFQKIAPLLYIKGALLPKNIEVEPEFFERWVTEEQWEDLFKTLREKFGSEDIYYTHNENFDSTKTSLADNMADLYQDLKDFVFLYQKSPLQSKACAVAELQKLYESHWGPILISALGAVHNNIFRQSLDPDEAGL